MKARFLALAALVLGMVSCQQEFDGAAQVGGEVDFQLQVAAPELSTRADDNDGDEQRDHNSAYGAIDYLSDVEWAEVDLRYTLEVYDVKDDVVIGTTPVKDRMVKIVDTYEPVAFDLCLVPNREYRFVVFADFVEEDATDTPTFDAQQNIGKHHFIGETLQNITIKEDRINDECTDAYFDFKDITITNSAAQPMVLKRPYGKVRVIATDLAELNLNVNPGNVVVEYEAAHVAGFNAVTGEIDATTVWTSTTYGDTYAETVSKETLADHYYTEGYDKKVENGRHTHMTLFTDYILAEEEQSTIHFTMTVNDKYGQEIKTTEFYTDIPVQRNHLTTIVGNVLTTATEINVTIDDNFYQPNLNVNAVFVGSARELQEALDAYENGQTILFDANIVGNVTIDQVEGKNYFINGNGYKFDGTITIDGNSRFDGEETVLIQNVNFETTKDINFIEQNSTDGAVRYAHNVTIEDCTFNGGDKESAMKIRQGYDIVVKNCEVKAGHSLAQLYGCTNVTIEGTKVNAVRGVSFGTSLNCVVKDSEFNVESYGLRYDGSVATSYNVENVKVDAYFPVIVRSAKADFALNFVGENTLTAPGYQVVLTSGSDEAPFVAPTNYTLTGADDFIVFPSDKKYVYESTQLQQFIKSAVNGDVIYFADDIEGDVTATQKPDVKFTIDGRGHNFAGVIVVDGKSATYTTAGLTIKNINFAAESISADACIRLGDGTNATRYTCNVTVEGCTFDVPGAVAVKSYTGGDKNLTISKCTATAKAHSMLQAKGIDGILVEEANVYSKNGLNFNNSNNVVVNNSNVNVKGYAVRFGEGSAANGGAETYTITNSSLKSSCDEDGDAVIVLRGTADKATLNINNTTIEGNPQIINNAADAKVYVDGVSAITSAEDLKAALLNGGTITLGSNVEGTFDITKANTKLVGVNGATITGRVNVSNCDGTVFENIKFKINDASKHKNTFTGAPYQYPGIVVAYGAQMTFEGCEFETSYAKAVCGINAGNHADSTDKLTVNNCKFVGDFYAIRTRTLFEITNNVFDIYTSAGTLAAVWTWGNANSGATIVTFTGNTNANANKVYGVQMTASNFVYDYVNINVQSNTNFHALADGVNPVRFNGTHTFAEGSETF